MGTKLDDSENSPIATASLLRSAGLGCALQMAKRQKYRWGAGVGGWGECVCGRGSCPCPRASLPPLSCERRPRGLQPPWVAVSQPPLQLGVPMWLGPGQRQRTHLVLNSRPSGGSGERSKAHSGVSVLAESWYPTHTPRGTPPAGRGRTPPRLSSTGVRVGLDSNSSSLAPASSLTKPCPQRAAG